MAAKSGPSTLQGWFAWPLVIRDSLVGASEAGLPGGLDRLVRHLQDGVAFKTMYSGQGSPEQAAHFLQSALRHQGVLGDGVAGFRYVEAADVDPLCRKVLRSWPRAVRPQHIFGDIVERLPPESLSRVRALTPSVFMYRARSAEDVALVQKAHAEVGRLIDGKGSFAPGSTGACEVHGGRQCPFWFPVSDADRTLTLVIAGVTCKDVSRMGLRRRASGPHWIPLKVWYAERRARQEDLIILECTEDFDFQEAQQELSPLYDMEHVLWGPQDTGVYIRRKRCFVLMHLRRSLVAVAGLDVFVDVFKRAPPQGMCEAARSKGDLFFCAPAEVVANELGAAGRSAGLPPPFGWRETLTGASLGRLLGYEEKRKAAMERSAGVPISDVEFSALVSAGGPLICDISQNAGGGHGREGIFVPTLLQKSHLWSHVRGRPLLGQEALVCQGVPVWDFLTSDGLFSCPYAGMLGDLSQRQLHNLAGNAICVPIIGQLLAFALSSRERRELCALSQVPVCTSSDSEDEGSTPSNGAKRQRAH